MLRRHARCVFNFKTFQILIDIGKYFLQHLSFLRNESHHRVSRLPIFYSVGIMLAVRLYEDSLIVCKLLSGRVNNFKWVV